MNPQRRRTNVKAEFARRHQLDFMKYCWMRQDPFIVGKHTKEICSEIDKAIENYRNGISSYLIVMVPFRHGKSDIVSRYLPPRFMGLFKDAEIIVASYAAELAHNLSRFARNVFKSKKFAEIFPGRSLNPDSAAVGHWEDYEGLGSATFVGVGGSGAGLGFSLGIIDDYCKNREEAESITIRDKTWNWFTDVFMTRRAPVSITLIACTPWNIDDLIGRLKKKMVEDILFPKFKIIKYAAESEDGELLFPERFSPEWYASMKSILGSYGTASLLQCDPIQRGGNMLKVDRIQIIDKAPDGLQWCRAWDLASTEDQVTKSDPDWTSGALVAMDYKFDLITREYIPKIYVKDIIAMKEEAPTRNRRIRQTADIDTQEIRIAVECVAGYKDTYTILENVFEGNYNIEPVVPTKDKVVRSTYFEPIIEAGNFFLVRGDWNGALIEEMASFPNGIHDDRWDSVMTGVEVLKVNHVLDFGEIEVKRK
jgi:predicted phage terminase large subunit-like protein